MCAEALNEELPPAGAGDAAAVAAGTAAGFALVVADAYVCGTAAGANRISDLLQYLQSRFPARPASPRPNPSPGSRSVLCTCHHSAGTLPLRLSP